MFDHTRAFSGFSVDDVPKAKQFYGETLGIPVSDHNGMILLHLAEGRDTLVYPKGEQHVPANFTILNFPVDDIEAAVDELTAVGIEMARFDGMDLDDRGIARVDGPPIAWFRDPAGNILSVIEE